MKRKPAVASAAKQQRRNINARVIADASLPLEQEEEAIPNLILSALAVGRSEASRRGVEKTLSKRTGLVTLRRQGAPVVVKERKNNHARLVAQVQETPATLSPVVEISEAGHSTPDEPPEVNDTLDIIALARKYNMDWEQIAHVWNQAGGTGSAASLAEEYTQALESQFREAAARSGLKKREKKTEPVNEYKTRDPTRRWKMDEELRRRAVQAQEHNLLEALPSPKKTRPPRLSFLEQGFGSELGSQADAPLGPVNSLIPDEVKEMVDDWKDFMTAGGRDISEDRFLAKYRRRGENQAEWNRVEETDCRRPATGTKPGVRGQEKLSRLLAQKESSQSSYNELICRRSRKSLMRELSECDDSQERDILKDELILLEDDPPSGRSLY